MQKLVSKSPILRFKLGNKILKALFGLTTPSLKGLTYSYEFSPAKTPLIGNQLPNFNEVLIPKLNYDPGLALKNLSSKQKIVKRSGKDKNGNPVVWNEDGNGNFISGQYVSDDGNTYWYGSDGSKTLIKKGNPKTVDSPKTITKQPINYQFGKMGGWSRSIGKGTINDPESLRMLKEMGMEKYSAGLVLDEINKQFGSNAVKRDDRWGNLSRAGLRSLYENWKLLNNNSSINTDINLPSKTLNSVIVNKEPITPTQITELAIVNNNVPTIENNGLKYFARTGNYNKSQLRGYMRSMGLNPYDFTGSERRALRLWLNGLSNDNSLLTGRLRDLFVTPYGYKQGGQLVSKNPIKRFKSNFR